MDVETRLPPAEGARPRPPLTLFVGWTMAPPAGAVEVEQTLASLARRLSVAGIPPGEALLGGGGRLLWRVEGAREPVEAALGAAGIHGTSFWRGVERTTPYGGIPAYASDQRANVVVELDRGVHVRLDDLVPRASACIAAHRVTLRSTVTGAGGEILLAFYRAPDAEAVRMAQRQGAVPAGRIWGFRILDRDGAAGIEAGQR